MLPAPTAVATARAVSSGCSAIHESWRSMYSRFQLIMFRMVTIERWTKHSDSNCTRTLFPLELVSCSIRLLICAARIHLHVALHLYAIQEHATYLTSAAAAPPHDGIALFRRLACLILNCAISQFINSTVKTLGLWDVICRSAPAGIACCMQS